MQTNRPTRHHQRGAVLAVALIMLVALMLLGVSAISVTSLEERMAGHFRDRGVAFQAGEAALRDGERVLQGAALPVFDGSSGYFPQPVAGETPIWDTINWTSSSITYTSSVSGVAAQPQFIIEEIANYPGTGDSLEAGVPIPDTAYYRVTARATGGTANSVVILQSTYRRL